MGTGAARCDWCGRKFDPDPYNAWHRRYCKDPECKRERKRKRQREWYATKKANDPEFRVKENARCAAANRHRRASARSGPAPPVRENDLVAVVAGMLAQWTDTNDPIELEATARRFADRGRRLALSGSFFSGGP